MDDDLRAIESLPVRPFFNHAVFVLATSLAFPVLVLNCLMLVDFKSGLFTLAVLTTGPLLVFAAYVWTATRIIANNPGECWKWIAPALERTGRRLLPPNSGTRGRASGHGAPRLEPRNKGKVYIGCPSIPRCGRWTASESAAPFPEVS